MELFLKLPPELIVTVQWISGVLLLLSLLTKSLRLLHRRVWRNVFSLMGRASVAIGRAVANTIRSPMRHPRVELVLTTIFSAIGYSQTIMLLLFVLATGLRLALHEPLPLLNFVGVLAAIVAIIGVAAFAFAEAERARVRAHELRAEW